MNIDVYRNDKLTMARSDGWYGISRCGEDDNYDLGMGVAVALLRMRKKANGYSGNIVNRFAIPLELYTTIILRDADVMEYTRLRVELSCRIKEAYQVGACEKKCGVPSKSAILEDVAGKLLDSCPSIDLTARLLVR